MHNIVEGEEVGLAGAGGQELVLAAQVQPQPQNQPQPDLVQAAIVPFPGFVVGADRGNMLGG